MQITRTPDYISFRLPGKTFGARLGRYFIHILPWLAGMLLVLWLVGFFMHYLFPVIFTLGFLMFTLFAGLSECKFHLNEIRISGPKVWVEYYRYNQLHTAEWERKKIQIDFRFWKQLWVPASILQFSNQHGKIILFQGPFNGYTRLDLFQIWQESKVSEGE